MLLAIDTATRILSLALHDGDRVLAECTLNVGRNHSALAAPLIQQIIAQTGRSSDDLAALAVCVGPGSYTGLRIGIALAKGLAAVGNLPLVPVNTLDIIAAGQTCAAASQPMIVTVPAGRSPVIWAVYRSADARWIAQSEPKLGNLDEMLAAADAPFILTGEITGDGLQQLRSAIKAGQAIKLISPAQRLRRAGHLAEIAWERLRNDGNHAFPADRALPVYLRSPGYAPGKKGKDE